MSDQAPLDQDLVKVLEGLPPAGGPSLFDLSPVDARAIFDAATPPKDEAKWRNYIGSTEDTDDGGDIPVPLRIYRPIAEGPVPTVIWFHGGGFMLGGIEQMDGIARRICRDLRAVVVSVGYRLAPEHQFPAALTDALSASYWVLDNADRLGGDRGRVALVGESAGGNLAISTALSLRSSGDQIAAMLLVAPCVDFSSPGEGPDQRMLSKADMRALTKRYLGGESARAGEYPPSPLFAQSLAGLPATIVGMAGHDILSPGIQRFVDRMRRDDVSVRSHIFGDMFHPFFGFADVSRGADTAFGKLMDELRDLLRQAA